MTHQVAPATDIMSDNKKNGFTLIETIIYIALFSILFAGVIGSTYPLFKSAERLTSRIIDDSEGIFVAQKISMLLASSTYQISTPNVNTLTITAWSANNNGNNCNSEGNNGGNGNNENNNNCNDTYTFTNTGGTLSLQKNSDPVLPLTATRVIIANFLVKNVNATAGVPHYIEYSFTTDGATTGPIRKYFPQIP